jgi:hypothetical protein
LHRLSHVLLLILLVAFAGLAYTSLEQKSVTIDEYGYLPAAFNLISTGEVRFSEWHTPLVNGLLGLPLVGADIEPITPPPGTPADGRYWFWNNGDWFADANGERYHSLLVRARLASLALGMALGVLVYRWAREISAPHAAGAAGLVAAALTLFHPEVIAHSRFATLDIGLTFFFTLSLYAFHRYLKAPSARQAVLAGAALGLAQASKFTSVLLLPVMFGLLIPCLLLPGVGRRVFSGVSRRSLWRHFALLLASALLVLHASYLFQDPITKRDSVSAHSERMKTWQQHWPDWMLIPIPLQYVRAVDHQFADQERRYQCYLNGETIRGGRVDYFATLLLAKTPLAGILLLSACVAAYSWRRMPRRLDSYVLLAPALLVLVAYSFSEKQIGLRMVLPLIPLVAIWIAAASPVWEVGRRFSVGAMVAVALFIASTLFVHPNYLSYFNLASGGTENGFRIGLGSNYDWGQDLPALAAWMKHREIDHVELLYYGRIDPAIYGIDYTVPRRFSPSDTPLVVSASHYGLRYPVPDHGERRNFDIPSRRDQIFESERWVSQRIAPTLFVFERP